MIKIWFFFFFQNIAGKVKNIQSRMLRKSLPSSITISYYIKVKNFSEKETTEKLLNILLSVNIFSRQNISPGLVETEITQQWLKDNSRLALKPKDVVDAILYSLQTPDNVLIKDLVITPIWEI